MPENAVPTKVAAVKEYGAEPALRRPWKLSSPQWTNIGMPTGCYVHPFGDPDIIAGQGTVGLEIMEDRSDVDTIAVCVGGGGLLAGIAVAAKALNPAIRIVGVEPEGAPAVTRSLIAGYPVTIEKITTVADGLAAPFAAPTSQRLIERLVDDVVIVTDDEILEAMRLLLERTKLLVEPAGAAATAALLAGKAGVKPGSRVVATLSGGNVDFEKLSFCSEIPVHLGLGAQDGKTTEPGRRGGSARFDPRGRREPLLRRLRRTRPRKRSHPWSSQARSSAVPCQPPSKIPNWPLPGLR